MRQPGLRRPVYYGWLMLVGVATAQVVSWGILYYAFSVLITPMQADLGWTTVELTGAYSLALLCAGLAAVPVGRWLDRHGPRALMTVGSVLAVPGIGRFGQLSLGDQRMHQPPVLAPALRPAAPGSHRATIEDAAQQRSTRGGKEV